jgi:hypothetical protein
MTSIPSTANPPKRMSIRRSLRELETLILFLIITVLAEFLVVLYAMSIGVKDQMPLQWSFTFPGTASRDTLSISPLFHLVPIAVILTLLANWTYLRRQVLIKPGEPQRGKLGSAGKGAKGQRSLAQRLKFMFSRRKKTTSPGREVRVRRTNMRSALIVLAAFSALLILISLFAYPGLIYNAIATAYRNDPSLLNFVKGVGAAVAPIGAVFSPINSVLRGAAPGFRDFVIALGAIITPLATLDNDGKYLVFQNAAAWISTLVILFYGKYGRKSIQLTRK